MSHRPFEGATTEVARAGALFGVGCACVQSGTTRARLRLAWSLAALLCGACGGEGPAEHELDTPRPAEFGYQVTPQTVLLMEGKKAYDAYCAGCHGVEGDGNGKAARFLNPAPRNFQEAKFKFMSTRFGELPTDEDLYRTITNGLRGSAMPAWGHLPERTRGALVAYIKTFSEDWEFGPTPAIPFVADPYVEMEDKSEAIARGEMAYHGYFTCWNCHPSYVSVDKINEYVVAMGGEAQSEYRADIHQPAVKADSADKTIFAPDFLRDYVKSGARVGDLYRTLGTGITGTAMPSWINVAESAPVDADGDRLVTTADLWAMAYYVQDLIKRRPVKFEPDQVVVRLNRELRFGDGGMEHVTKVPDVTQ